MCVTKSGISVSEETASSFFNVFIYQNFSGNIVKFILEQAMKAERRSRGMAVLLLEPRSLDVCVWSMPHPGRLTPVNEPAPII